MALRIFNMIAPRYLITDQSIGVFQGGFVGPGKRFHLMRWVAARMERRRRKSDSKGIGGRASALAPPAGG
jgi:hypothetical protein